jgi:hypothetical protein
VIAPSPHDRCAAASVNSSFVFVQTARFRATYSGSDKAVGEEQRELALRARPRVRAVHDVLGELECEVAADRPGAESSGLVAPIIVRTTEIADSPLTASASTGPEVMKPTSEPKNGLPLCSP